MSVDVRPIYIIGAAHSGTTILYRMLAMHPEVTWFSQFSQRSGSIPERFSLPFANQIDWALRRLFRFDWQKREGKLKRLFVPRPGEANRIWDYVLPNDNSVHPEESASRLQTILESECRFWHTPYILAKLPRLYKHISLLYTAYPQSKFIHIVRDGRAVALSVRHKFIRGGQSRKEGLHQAAKYWVEVLSYVDRQRTRISLIEVRYEDLCLHVHDMLEEIMQRVGLNPQKFPFKRCPTTLEITNPKWLREASLEELKLLVDVEKEYLEKYGYLRGGYEIEE